MKTTARQRIWIPLIVLITSLVILGMHAFAQEDPKKEPELFEITGNNVPGIGEPTSSGSNPKLVGGFIRVGDHKFPGGLALTRPKAVLIGFLGTSFFLLDAKRF